MGRFYIQQTSDELKELQTAEPSRMMKPLESQTSRKWEDVEVDLSLDLHGGRHAVSVDEHHSMLNMGVNVCWVGGGYRWGSDGQLFPP